MLESFHKRHVRCLIILFSFFFISSPADASNTGDLAVYFLLTVAYLVLLGLCLITHAILILSKAYTKKSLLIVALIVINALCVLGVSPALIFISESVTGIAGYICFWGILVVIPLYQYWHDRRFSNSRAEGKEASKWMVWGTVLFYFIMAIFLFKPIAGHYRSERFNKQLVISRQKHDESLAKEKQKRQQELLEKKQKNAADMSQRQEKRIQKQKEDYTKLLETILINQPAEVVKLKTMTSSEVQQLVASGTPPRSVDAYFIDQSQMLEDAKVDELKTLLRDPLLYDFEYKGVLNPFIRDSQFAVAVLFGKQLSPARILFYRDKGQITIINVYDVESVKLKENSQVERFFSNIGWSVNLQ